MILFLITVSYGMNLISITVSLEIFVKQLFVPNFFFVLISF